MSITIAEKPDSRESTTGSSASVNLKYIIQGTSSDVSAKEALEAGTVATYDGLERKSCQITPIGDPTVSLAWEGTVRYALASVPGDSSFSFDTGGGTQHITQSISTEHSHAASGAAPDFGGAIGVTQDKCQRA